VGTSRRLLDASSSTERLSILVEGRQQVRVAAPPAERSAQLGHILERRNELLERLGADRVLPVRHIEREDLRATTLVEADLRAREVVGKGDEAVGALATNEAIAVGPS